MSDDLMKQSLAELHDIVRCRCHEAYTGRGLHDPNCECDSADAVKVVADRIEELELEVETWKSRALHQNEVAGRLEAKLAQQDELVQAAVAAALREAANIARASLDGELGYDDILALITPDAQAALDRYVKERSDELVAAENERLRNALHKIGEHSKMNAYSSAHIICHACSDTHHAVEAAIRKGGEDA